MKENKMNESKNKEKWDGKRRKGKLKWKSKNKKEMKEMLKIT